jgi:hypothetical protein
MFSTFIRPSRILYVFVSFVLQSSGFKSTIDDPQRLVLRNVTKEDQGWYTCLVANTVGMNYRSAWLTVLNGNLIYMVSLWLLIWTLNTMVICLSWFRICRVSCGSLAEKLVISGLLSSKVTADMSPKCVKILVKKYIKTETN